jgi:hypothetical protein
MTAVAVAVTFTGARRHQCLYKRVPIGTATGLESCIARNRDIRRNPLHLWPEISLGRVGRWCLRCLARGSPRTVWRPRRPRGSRPLDRVRKGPGNGHMPHQGDLARCSRLGNKLLAALRPLGSLGRDQTDHTLHQRPIFARILHLLVLRLLSCCICLWQRLPRILYWLLRHWRKVPIRFFLDCRG